jgi:hypothetical protein
MDAMRAWVLTALVLPVAVLGQVIRFDRLQEGGLPPGWSVAMTHEGGPPKWQIVRDESAPHPPMVFAQISRDSTAGRFPLAIWDKTILRDGEVNVAFKAVDGEIDRAAGVVWRYKDPNNYYIVRANALENNVVLYKVQAGVRLSIAPKGLPSRAYGVRHDVPTGKWQSMRVVFKEHLFTVSLNGSPVFEVEDQTFNEPGKVGLWTKADSVTYFADFSVTKY